MTDLVEELSQKAMSLEPGERVRLAEALLATVQEEDADVDAAWDAEIKRRVADLDNRTTKFTLAEEVFAEVRRLIK
jgi:putative addiction module component (TIGR02574 family)